ncbi:MAG TPA: hypothetical protein ENF38_01400, partial [Candidatus Aenigmarchaeota archaeon]|nr:hypothetical protein [Candidatus Aenigmarchaeota archaeon]
EKVLQLLSMARIRPNGYNIILQGDVTQIIEMSPLERRTIIDEISGIHEYNEKKEKALRDLEAVEQKLKEAEIIISQKLEIFKKLEEERNAALRYQELQSQLEILKGSLVNKKLQKCLEEIEKVDKKIRLTRERKERVEEELDEVEEKLEEKERIIEDVARKVVEISKRVEIEKKLSELRSQLQIKKSKIDANKAHIERLDSLIDKLQSIQERRLEALEEMPHSVKAILKLGLRGVYGTIAQLISVPEEYKIAIEVAAGPHLYDIVVENEDIASFCIEYLRRERIGRATFLPLNKLKPKLFKDFKLLSREGVIDVASKLVKFNTKFLPAIEFVFGNTLIVRDLEAAKLVGIGKVRMVTLEGDLIERSGAMTGGYIVRKRHPISIERDTERELEHYIALRKSLKGEISILEDEIKEIEKEIEKLSKSESLKEFIDLEKLRISSQREIDALRQKKNKLNEKKINLEIELNRLKIERAKLEKELEELNERIKEFEGIEFIDDSIHSLEKMIKANEKELQALGLVNLKAIEEYEKFKKEFESYREKYQKILEEKEAVLRMIEKIEEKRREVFMKTLEELSIHFNNVFNKMTGGVASLSLEDPENIESGLLIRASPAGKSLLNIDAMSGGEKTITALAFLFAIQKYKPAPFYIFDEIDAALDKENTKKVAEFIKLLSKKAQFIVITHNDQTIKYADRLYGVSMVDGESKIIGLELPSS